MESFLPPPFGCPEGCSALMVYIFEIMSADRRVQEVPRMIGGDKNVLFVSLKLCRVQAPPEWTTLLKYIRVGREYNQIDAATN